MQHLYSLEDLTEINVSPIKATGEMCDEEGISFLLRTYNSRIFKGAVNGSRRLQLLPGQPATPRTASQKVVWFYSAQLV